MVVLTRTREEEEEPQVESETRSCQYPGKAARFQERLSVYPVAVSAWTPWAPIKKLACQMRLPP